MGVSEFVSSVKEMFLGPNPVFPEVGGSMPAIANKAPAPPELYARLFSANPALMTRRQRAIDKLKVYENDFYALVEERLRKSFHPENYERLKLTIHTSTNPLRKISRDVSVLYEQPAQRRLLDKTQPQTQQGEEGLAADDKEDIDSPDEAEAAALDTGDAEVDALEEVIELEDPEADEDSPFVRLMKAVDWDVLLDEVEKLVTSQGIVWVRPVVTGPLTPDGKLDPTTAKLKYVIYTPADAVGVPDPADSTQLVAFYYWADDVFLDGGQAKNRKVVWYYDAQTVKKFEASDGAIGKELERYENKLGRVPVTAFRIDHPRNGYYADGTGNDLFEATLELCLLKTIQNQRAKDFGFKQLVIVGVNPEDIPQDQVMGGSAPILIPGGEQGSGASVLDLQPALTEWTQLCKDRAADLFDTYGISVDVEQTGQPESGYAKKLRMAKVLKESRRRRKFFAEGEKDLYACTAKTLEVFPVDSIGKPDPSAELVTDFAEPQFEENPKEQSHIDSLRLKMNLDSIIDVMRRDNPDLTDAELVQQAYRNKRINEVLMTADQVRLTDLLATRAIAGASLGKAGGGEDEPVDGVTKPGQRPGGPPKPGGEG